MASADCNATGTQREPYQGERVLKHDPQEVKLYGKCAAFILAQLRYWEGRGKAKLIDGWACFTSAEWANQIPYSDRSLVRAFTDLVAAGKIEKKENAWRNSPGYRTLRQDGDVNPAKMAEQSANMAESEVRQNGEAVRQNGEVPRQNGEVTNIRFLEKEKKEKKREEPDAAPKRAPRTPKLTDAQSALLPLAIQLKTRIDQYDADKDTVHPNPPEKSVVILERLIRSDGILADQFMPVLEHCLADEFWQEKCLSIGQWREESKRNGRPKFVNMRASWLGARAPLTRPGSSEHPLMAVKIPGRVTGEVKL